MSIKPKIQWPRLGQGNFELVLARFDEHPGERALVIRGDGKLSSEQIAHLKAAGFQQMKNFRTIWARRGNSLKLREIRAAFPDCKTVLMDPADADFRVRGPSPFVKPEEPQPTTPPKAVNRFQVEYRPGSKLGKPIAMIPINMAPATAKALAMLEEVHGSIDDYVARRLDMTLFEIERVLSPEQIDAIGLALFATERGREFLLADQTGLGKGRVLAGLVLAGRVSGKKVIFITEKANLFSDFWRDLKDIGADRIIGAPFLLNNKARIIDVTSINGDLLFESLDPRQLKKVIKSRALPPENDFMMGTYSQFNRARSPKNEFLAEISKDALVLLDEAHNAAGSDSNVGKSLAEALQHAWGILRSSATFARRAASLLAYPKVLPPSWRTPEAFALLSEAGNELAEVMSEALAEDGVLIRREQDLSGININIEVDTVNLARNEEMNDAVAPILSALRKLQRQVDDEIEERNIEGGNPEGKPNLPRWYSANFGSRLQPIMRQFMSALSVDHTVEMCVKELLAGRKPVVVIEQTMESLMRELSGDAPVGADDTEEFYTPVEMDDDDSETDAEETVAPNVELSGPRPPTFQDALLMMLDRIMHMSHKKGKEDPVKHKVEDQRLMAQADVIREMIALIPPLSLSPIDDIRDRVEAISRGLHAQGIIERPWVCDEISARKTRVIDGRYVPYIAPDRNDTIVGYNSGGIDLLVLTLAASTGLSLHASEHFADQRQRTMILLQIPADITRFLQMLGRVNRRGQTSIPFFKVPSTGLPAQNRTLAKENKKLSSMSANVSANADNATSMDVQDFIDSLGNEVAQRMLEDQPRLAERMNIGMKGIDQENADQELYYINKMLQSMWYLKASEQNVIFDRLAGLYEDALKAMLAKGQSPRGTREMPGNWEEVGRVTYEHANPADGDVFGRAVELVTMQGSVETDPITSDRILEMLRASRSALADLSGNVAGPYFEEYQKSIRKNQKLILRSAMSGRMVSVEMALADKEDNAVKRTAERLKMIVETLGRLAPGTVLGVPDEDGDKKYAVIVGINAPTQVTETGGVRTIVPDMANAHSAGQWGIRYVAPGDTHVREVSLASILRDKAFELVPTPPADQLKPDLKQFDWAPRGIVKVTREFLVGNLVKAVAIASEVKAGSMVSWFDKNGNRQRSVLVNRSKRSALLDRSTKTTDIEKAKEILFARKVLFSNPLDRTNGLFVRKLDKGFEVSLPLTKTGQVVKPDEIGQFTQTFRAGRKEQSAYVTDLQIENLLKFVFSKGVALHYDAPVAAPKPANSQGRPGQFRRPPMVR